MRKKEKKQILRKPKMIKTRSAETQQKKQKNKNNIHEIKTNNKTF